MEFFAYSHFFVMNLLFAEFGRDFLLKIFFTV